MKMRLWNLRYGNKGFVLSLDIAMAVFIVILFLIVANQYVNRDDNSLSSLQMIRVGSDIMAVLDYKGVLNSLNSGAIKEGKDALLPVNYGMKIKIDCNNVDTLEEVKEKLVGSGERIFVVNGERYCIGRFWIWLK